MMAPLWASVQAWETAWPLAWVSEKERASLSGPECLLAPVLGLVSQLEELRLVGLRWAQAQRSVARLVLIPNKL
jgi:hypothetical protein